MPRPLELQLLGGVQGRLRVGKTLRFPTDRAMRSGVLRIKKSDSLGDSVLPLEPLCGLRDPGPGKGLGWQLTDTP